MVRLGPLAVLSIALVLFGGIALGIGIPFGPELLIVFPLVVAVYLTYRLAEFLYRKLRGSSLEL